MAAPWGDRRIKVLGGPKEAGKSHMAKKLQVGVLFGGRSGEHEISLRSARSILKAIDRRRYEVVPIGITRQGRWLAAEQAQALLDGTYATRAQLAGAQPASRTLRSGAKKATAAASGLDLEAGVELAQAGSPTGNALGVDVVFPVLHGTFGEDGTMQGLFELADVAYVGSGVLGSAVSMDKDAMKRAFAAAGLPLTPHVTLLRSAWRADPKRCTRQVEQALIYPVFVKPANLGSSVGIGKVHNRAELAPAMEEAASFDRKIVIEQGVGGAGVKPRELEIAVLGNDEPEASVIGEIVPAKEFYDYHAKYELDGPDESVSIIPAKLTQAEEKQIRAMALAAFRACDCAGLARVDFLMAPAIRAGKNSAGKARAAQPAAIYLNEVNTMPGFTSISMYPKLWQASGLSYRSLIDRLIQLALERAAEKRQTSYSK
jgi:D-alanine-D-alanine ligase